MRLFILAALLSASGAAAQSVPALPITSTLPVLAQARAQAPLCRVNMYPDYHLGISYYARLVLAPGCPASGVGRVRKTSTINTKAAGARYQPIKPDGSAEFGGLYSWTLTRSGSNIPRDEHWTWNRWTWQWYDGRTWKAVGP